MCRDGATGQLYALKSILKALVLKQNKHRQALSEREALATADHRTVIGLRATFQDRHHVYLLMELAQGGELWSLLEAQGTLEEAHAKYYTASIVLALGHLHRAGFMYRDLKPENVLLDASGRLKLCDMGLAKRAHRGWTLVGTPEYVAPEVVRGEGATQAVDWWQLGVLAFEMLAGVLPFEAPAGMDEKQKDKEIFKVIAAGAYEWPDEAAAAPLPREFVAALLRKDVPGRPGIDPLDTGEAPPPAERELRLGTGGGDAAELIAHPWLADVDWLALADGTLEPPFIPLLDGDDDDSNFGPIETRGEPLRDAPDYDPAWDSFFSDW